MVRSLAWTTRDAELSAVAVAGRPVAAAWPQLASHLARRLSPAHAALLAEPSPDPGRGATDWFAEGEGPGVALDEAPDSIPAFEALVAALRAEAARLGASRDEAERLLGEMLDAALEIPDRALIRLRGEAIVMVAWGHRQAGRARGAELLRSLPGTRPRAPMLRLAPAAPPGRGWLLPWLAALPLLLAIGLFLAWRDPLGWLPPPVAQCVIDPADFALLGELDAAEAAEIVLRDRLAQIALEAGQRRLACPPAGTATR